MGGEGRGIERGRTLGSVTVMVSESGNWRVVEDEGKSGTADVVGIVQGGMMGGGAGGKEGGGWGEGGRE